MCVAAWSRCYSRLLMYGHTSLSKPELEQGTLQSLQNLQTECHCQARLKTVEGILCVRSARLVGHQGNALE